VDALSFGGTKQGLLAGEAVVFLKPGLGDSYPYIQKHAMQLASKMRFIAAQFEALLQDDLWVANGRQANASALALESAVQDLPYVRLAFPVQANSVFAHIPLDLMTALQEETFFWPWDEREGLVRWMCAFDTRPEDIQAFVAALRRLGPAA
jgi:threonine aldolase